MTLLKGKRRTPNIVRGGRAIPFGNPNDNLYYLQGRSHAKGGIDIGANPRTGIEAEGGEVVQIKPNELRVLSAQDFIGGGVSPAKQVLAGANPDKVFNEQERFKDRHRINDDGSKYETGGDKKSPWSGQDNEKRRERLYRTVNPGSNFFSLTDWINNGILYLVNDKNSNRLKHEEFSSNPEEEEMFKSYLSDKPVYEVLPKTDVRLAKDINPDGTYNTNKQYVGLSKRQKDSIRDNLIEDYLGSPADFISSQKGKNGWKVIDDRRYGDGYLSMLGKFSIRENNNSGIYEIMDTYDFPSWIPIPDRNKGHELVIRDTVWTKDAKPELYIDEAKIKSNFLRNVINKNKLDKEYEIKQNGGMIATINGNVKNGLISTPRPKAKGGTDIHIKPSKRGTFTAAAKAHGKSVQGFASQVLANKDNYSSAMVKKANFARNASKWNHKACGGRAKAEYGKYKTIADIFRSALPSFYEGQTKVANYSDEKKEAANEIINAVTKNNNDDNSIDAISSANSTVDEMHQMDTPVEKQLDEVVVTAKRKPKYSRRQQEFYDRGGYNHSAYNSYLPQRESVKVDNNETSSSNETKRSGINRNDILGYGQYRRLVENPGDLTVDEIIAATNTAERMGRNFNEDRARRTMNQNGDNTTSPSTGDENSDTSDSNGSTSSSSTTPRKGNASSASSNNYSVTNYEIQPDGTLKANGTRTGQGFKQYSKRKNQKTITDARVSRPWRETIGSDADVLNYIANGDAFEHKRWQDRHSKMSQETGYDYSKERAIQHEDVSGYSRDFNEKFNLANRKLGNYTTPAGKTGDNAQGERRKKFGGRRLAPNGTTTDLERPYEDDWYGAQVEMRQLGKNLTREDYKYLQEQINARRQSPLRRAVFERNDGYAGVIDELATPEIKGADITAPKIDLSPISKTVVPQAHARAAQRDALNRAPFQKNWRDEIGLGLGLAGSILDPILRGRQLRNLESWTPYTESPVKLKTNWNINPQLDRIRESSQEAYRDIDANTASSSTALARKQRVRNQAQYSANQQWGIKENKETELINQDKLNLQGVRNRNTNRLNTWAADNTRIRNQITMAKADNISNAIQNVVGVGLDYLGRKDFKDYVNNTKAAIAAGAPNVDDRILVANGLNLGDLYNTGIPTLATNPYRRSKFGSRNKLKRR